MKKVQRRKKVGSKVVQSPSIFLFEDLRPGYGHLFLWWGILECSDIFSRPVPTMCSSGCNEDGRSWCIFSSCGLHLGEESFGIRRRVIQNGKISDTFNSETRRKTEVGNGNTSMQAGLNDGWSDPHLRQRFFHTQEKCKALKVMTPCSCCGWQG